VSGPRNQPPLQGCLGKCLERKLQARRSQPLSVVPQDVVDMDRPKSPITGSRFASCRQLCTARPSLAHPSGSMLTLRAGLPPSKPNRRRSKLGQHHTSARVVMSSKLSIVSQRHRNAPLVDTTQANQHHSVASPSRTCSANRQATATPQFRKMCSIQPSPIGSSRTTARRRVHDGRAPPAFHTLTVQIALTHRAEPIYNIIPIPGS
jgi:hypothetical protein